MAFNATERLVGDLTTVAELDQRLPLGVQEFAADVLVDRKGGLVRIALLPAEEARVAMHAMLIALPQRLRELWRRFSGGDECVQSLQRGARGGELRPVFLTLQAAVPAKLQRADERGKG